MQTLSVSHWLAYSFYVVPTGPNGRRGAESASPDPEDVTAGAVIESAGLSQPQFLLS